MSTSSGNMVLTSLTTRFILKFFRKRVKVDVTVEDVEEEKEVVSTPDG